MRNENIKVKRIIQRCGCDSVLPFALVYIFYVILHGHLSPGGGFQGGVLMVAVVLLIYLGHGYENTVSILHMNFMRKTESVALILYIALAFAGVAMGANFCQNVFELGVIGALESAGTISLMNKAVGLDVLTGVTALALSMLGILMAQDIDFQE